MRWIAAVLCCACALGASAGTLQVKYHRPASDLPRAIYYYDLLEAALQATAADRGDFQLEAFAQEMTPERINRELIDGKLINVHWRDGTDRQLNRHAVRVGIPLDRGLLGHRVLLIRKEDRERFRAIKTVDELRRVLLGQARHWGDVDILRSHGFDVVEGSYYPALFGMLAAKRFDALPRSVLEAPRELAAHSSRLPELEVEQTLLLVYPLPVYFYVSPGQEALALRLEEGLQRLKADGRWDALFDRHFKKALADLHLEQRRTFRLENRFLPAEAVQDIAPAR